MPGPRKKRDAKRVALVLLISLCITVVLAHDMWLESSSFVTFPGEKITIRNGNGTIFHAVSFHPFDNALFQILAASIVLQFDIDSDSVLARFQLPCRSCTLASTIERIDLRIRLPGTSF